MVQTDKGQKIVEGVRNNQRILFTHQDLADEIWTSLKPSGPSNIGNSVAIGLNKMFRFYKYRPSAEFKKHRNQSYIRTKSKRATSPL